MEYPRHQNEKRHVEVGTPAIEGFFSLTPQETNGSQKLSRFWRKELGVALSVSILGAHLPRCGACSLRLPNVTVVSSCGRLCQPSLNGCAALRKQVVVVGRRGWAATLVPIF